MNFRIFHGLMYVTAAFYALQKDAAIASNIILADTAVGLGLFLQHTILKNNPYSSEH